LYFFSGTEDVFAEAVGEAVAVAGMFASDDQILPRARVESGLELSPVSRECARRNGWVMKDEGRVSSSDNKVGSGR